MDQHLVKTNLFRACLNVVEERMLTITDQMSSLKKALFSETKSSVGDKHETGRAMIQLEMEKASQQLASVQQMKKTLRKIEQIVDSDVISLGNLVITDKGNYYLSISVGDLEVDGTSYYCVSTKSPIGGQLLGKSIGDIVSFNKAKILKVF